MSPLHPPGRSSRSRSSVLDCSDSAAAAPPAGVRLPPPAGRRCLLRRSGDRSMADKDNQATGAHVEMAPQSALTSSRGVSSPPAKMQRLTVAGQSRSSNQSTSTSELDAAPQDAEKSKKAPPTLSRCNMLQIERLKKAFRNEHMTLIDESDAGCMHRMDVLDTVPARVIRKVAYMVNDRGELILPGIEPLNLYDLAPLVTGYSNEGDFVNPALGHPIDRTILKGVLRTDPNNLRGMSFVVTKLMDMANKCKLTDVDDADEFIQLYKLASLGSMCTPSSNLSVNPKYLGVFCTGDKYRMSDHIVDYMVKSFKNYRNGVQTVNGCVYLPITVIADFAILDGDETDPPRPGIPRFEAIKQERLNRLFDADLDKLKYRTFENSVYSGHLHQRRDGDALSSRSSHGSSPQPVVVDVDDHYCEPAMAKKLLTELHKADSDFIENFSAFTKSLCNEKLDGDTKVKAMAVLDKIKVSGKQIATDDGLIPLVFQFMSEHKDIFVNFSDKLKKYISATDLIDRQRTAKAQDIPGKECGCTFRYPSDTGEVVFSCKDLLTLEPNKHIIDSMVNVYTYHMRGPHILPELMSSEIHGQYFIMDALYYGVEIRRDEKKTKHPGKKFLFWPVNGGTEHWSLAIICNEEKRPAILHLDSLLGGHNSEIIFSHLEAYMHKVLEVEGVINKEKLKVPIQPAGSSDCGPFMLYNIKKFIMDYGNEKAITIDENWYDPESASAVRGEIANLIRMNKMRQGPEDCTCGTAKKWENCLVKRM